MPRFLLAAHNEPSAIVENFVTRGKNDLSLEEGTAQEAWASLCELLNRHGIDLHVAIAPAPATSVAAWRLGGQIRSLAHAISNVDGSVCSKAIHHDFNTPILYADVSVFRTLIICGNRMRPPIMLINYQP